MEVIQGITVQTEGAHDVRTETAGQDPHQQQAWWINKGFFGIMYQ
jgi:hypothetical protein